MQKVYVTEEQKEKFMEKVNRDVEVRDAHLSHMVAAAAALQPDMDSFANEIHKDIHQHK